MGEDVVCKIGVADWGALAYRHEELWDVAVRPHGLLTAKQLQERRQEGEPRVPAPTVATLLRGHSCLQSFVVAKGAASCAKSTRAVAAWLDGQTELRLKRSDWTILLEICTGAEDGLADLALQRVDHLQWPAFVLDMARGRGCPSLGTFCARRVLREPATFSHNMSEMHTALCSMRSGGVWFHAARLNCHDPVPEMRKGGALRAAQLAEQWPTRSLLINGGVRLVHWSSCLGRGTGTL